MNKILKYSFCIFIILNLFSRINCNITEDEQIQAERIFSILGQLALPICSYFTCSGTDGEVNRDITGIIIHPSGENIYDLSSIDFSVFKNVHQIDLGRKIIPPLNLLSQIKNYTNLISLSVYGLVEGVDVSLPSSLVSIAFENFKGTFYTKWVNADADRLYVHNTIDFSISGAFVKSKITSLDFPIPPQGFPDLSTLFPNLISVAIYFKEVTLGSSYIPSSFLGSIEKLPVSSVIFEFDANTTKKELSKKIYLPDFSRSPLYYFRIDGDGFVLNQGQSLDFINSFSSFEISLINCKSLFKTCSNCYKVPIGSKCEFSFIKFYVDQVDLRNCTKIKLWEIEPSQNITFNNMNFKKLSNLDITNTSLSGDLPDEMCQMGYTGVSIKNNLFSTKVPSCYICTSDQSVRTNILPNKFTTFGLESPASCPNFKIEYKDLYLVDTRGDVIVISGKDLGFNVDVEGVDSWDFTVPNELIRIYTEKGLGTTNKTIKVTFNDREKQISFNYHYAPPEISSYYVDTDNGIIFFVGSGFSTESQANANMLTMSDNDTPYSAPFSNREASSIFVYISGLQKPPTAGQVFSVQVVSGSQQSKEVSFVYGINQIGINDDIAFNSGDTTVISGTFPTTDPSKVSIVIKKDYYFIECTTLEVSNTLLTFTCPKSDIVVGTDLPFYLTIDGLFCDTIATVYQVYGTYTPPPTPSPIDSSSSSSPSPSPSPSPSQTSSSDEVSSSLKLEFPLTLILGIFLFSLFK
ncbi:hypothetical protein DICPUDRAFT_83291 [Dictyostelium purpureum]|uniref:IPT/TIG domain-containing protein n=1 Tax=Dictyostelium purpureum TaxID=5786 RepID=F0ZZ41_DICPU|nr:uncharacterized protein DICPUDRAFT_83291 [Dictyostelium purpureum]EGC30789.1 hypothetical protein DICPUDRAFT_83291 [Dictyostelium purpureum]|eukprot:XP_003292679.1 hypothetical protein DICPUDRAFT_83291 [Dictyostelium purpureum]